MSEIKAKRLSKVAREFNVGLSTIVDYLKGKGIEIDAKPNSKIEPDVYGVLLQEFQTEKMVKEEARQVNLPKASRDTVSIETHEVKPARGVKEQDEIIIKNMENVSAEGEVISGEAEKNVTVVGKIDLGAFEKKPKKSEKQPPIEEKKEEKEHTNEAEQTIAKDKGEESEEVIKAKAEKLEGPKVVDKIELPAEKKKPVPVASSSENAESGKRKRKRIRTDNVPSGNRGGGKPAFKKGKSPARPVKQEPNEEEIKKEISETLARLSGGGKSKGAKYRRAKREAISNQMEADQMLQEREQAVLKVTEFVTASELASLMDVSVNEIISACMSLGMFVSINQRMDAEILTLVAEEFGFTVEFTSADEDEIIQEEEDKEEDLESRPPIVTVMGHVDHGKTSLLDYIRNAKVIDKEAGGITQHIGAYSVTGESGKKITFLDTPGHEAFTAMRARGAQVTDIVIIVIAADDSVMPQTKEAINHAQAANVPMVFAFNKIDREGANADKIREELSQMNILVEEWGGKYQTQEISAKTGQGIEELLEKVLLEAELLELKANPNKKAVGTVIESTLDKGRGYVTTVLVQAGTMRVGDVILAGSYYGRVKAMHDERGKNIEAAGPARPVSMLGLNGASSAGDKFNIMNDDKEAKAIATKRLQLQREQGIRTQKHITLDEIGRRLAIGDFQELNIIVKGDVDGSIEAIADSLIKLSTDKIQVNVIHKSVGQISESDVLLASASDAIITGFQVRPSASARKLAEKEEIDVRLYSVIYDAIDEVKAAMEGMLAPKVEEQIVGNVEVRDVFKISKVGTIAGCYVQDGKITRNTKIRVIRDGIVVYTGELGSLKRFKDDVKEVTAGYECGLNIEKYNDIKVGDILEGFEEVEVKQTL